MKLSVFYNSCLETFGSHFVYGDHFILLIVAYKNKNGTIVAFSSQQLTGEPPTN